MSRVCQITGKKPLRGHNVSHANNRTIKIQDINLHSKRYFLPELKQWIRIRVSTRGIRLISKLGGLSPYLLKTPSTELDPELRPVKRSLAKRLKIATR